MELYLFLSVMFIASILQAITGFGGALIAAPLLLLFIDKTTSVISLTFVSIAINALLLVAIRKPPIDKKTFYDLFIPSLIGLPIGLLVLDFLDAITLRILVGVFSIIFALLLFTKIFKFENSRVKRIFAGWFSGVLRTSVGLNSPPIVLLLASENTDKDEMRKTMAFLFLAMSIVSVGLFYFTGRFTPEIWVYCLWSIPVALIGGWVGNMVSKKVSQKGFIWSVLILISLTILISVYSGIKQYLL